MMKIGRIVPSIFAMFIFTYFGKVIWDFPGGSLLKNLPANLGDGGDMDQSLGKIPWRRQWQPTQGFLPVKSNGQRSLAGYSS